MVDFPGNMEWVADLIPDLTARLDPFIVDTEEVDDELVEVFFDEIRRLADELQSGLSRNDAEMLRIAAHSIKGMGGTVGLPEISVLGLEIENMAKESRLDDARPLADALSSWLASLS